MPKRVASEPTGLIKSVEIAYFRSFYKVTFQPLRQMNVVFGENDTGKSNVMRALNLFFNGVTSGSDGFDLDIDLSRKRLADTGEGVDVRTFVYVKVTFRTPREHRTALGSEFYVKRTWSQTTGEDYRQEVSRHIDTPGKRNSLTRILNKIKFTYIPAVKDRRVYEDLLVDAYNAIAEVQAFSSALETFTAEIRNQTEALSERLNHSLGLTSALAPPKDLADLFSSLDFETLIGSESSMSLLKQRGDGIQARHIPEIISFTSEKDPRPFHIWGLEEPENSLSMNSALAAANRLRELAKNQNLQLFITTHSPAFYSLDGEDVAKFFLKSGNGEVDVRDGTGLSRSELMEFMGDQFYLPAISEALSEAEARARDLEASVANLRASIETANRPLLFVEGPSDLAIINEVLRLRRLQALVEVVSLDGVGHAERLSAMTPALVEKLLGGRIGFVLLDSDKAGCNALPKTVSARAARSAWAQSKNKIHWRILPLTDEARRAFAAAGIEDQELTGVTLEDCYSAQTRRQAIEAGTLELGKPRDFVFRGDLFGISPVLADETHKFYLLQTAEAYKTSFANWLIQHGHARCESIDQIIDEVAAILRA